MSKPNRDHADADCGPGRQAKETPSYALESDAALLKCVPEGAGSDAIECSVCGRATDRGVSMGLYIKTDPIIWSGETAEGNAVAALAECGWDEERRQHELTLAISEEGRYLVQELLEDLVSRAQEEKDKQRSKASSKGGDL